MKINTAPSVVLSIPVILFIVGITLVEIMLSMHQHNVEKTARIDALAFANDLRAHADQELNRVLYLTSGLGSYLAVRRDNLQKDEIENILRVAYGTSRHVRNFGVALGYQLTYIYPEVGNEEAIGLNYRDQPKQWHDVELAISTHTPVLSEQVQLLQGGLALIYRDPIYVDGNYWGILSTVIDSDSFLQDTFGYIKQSNYEFAVRGASVPNLWGDSSLFDDPDIVVLRSDIGWQFAVKPFVHPGYLSAWILRILGWSLALAMAAGLYSVLAHRRTLTHLALYDALTGLPNRILLNDRIDHALQLAERQRHEKLIVFFIDIDDFKIINDSYGYRTGDLVLKTVAQRLESCARVGDTAARWGTDEFVLLMEDLADAGVADVLERIAKVLADPIYSEGHRLQVTASIGYAVAFKDATAAADLVWTADRRMYANKRRRKQINQ